MNKSSSLLIATMLAMAILSTGVSASGLAEPLSVTNTKPECSWPLTSCFQYTAQWVRVGFAGRSPTQLNLVNPQCPAS